jgi:PAS domain S-box-containing protein
VSAAPRTSILIVEDEGIIAHNIQELLTSLGYDAFAIAASADEAVARASERCPDAVLMDVHIKGKLDGIETAAIVHDRFDVPIIYLTAHADEATLERAKKTEPFGYLVKPVKAAELRSAIEIACYKHAMESRLRTRERWFTTTVQSIADAIVTVDLVGNVTFINQAAEKLLGMTLSEAKGRPARDVLRLHGDAVDDHETLWERVLRERKVIHIPEAQLDTGHGPMRLIADSAAPVMDNHELLGAVIVFRDITEQRNQERQLEIADRLTSLGTMAAGVAHEINNPLAVVLGNAELVMEYLVDSAQLGRPPVNGPEAHEMEREEAIDAQRQVLSAVSRITRIVSDLKAFSRTEPTRDSSVDVRNAIEWAVRSTAHEIRNRARLSTELKEVPRVDADETRLGQVLINLLINAAQAIAPGNVSANLISIATGSDAEGHVIIRVSDTGPGIPPELMRRIFEPFFTTKPVGVGTGLGLSICHGIVKSMGGTLAVESRLGEGTTFTLALPASVKEEQPAALAPGPDPAERHGRLLLIDDEEMMLQTLSRILCNHEVILSQDAREALELLAKDGDFDIIFCDLMMPRMNGMDFYEELLRTRPQLAHRVVFLTGGATTPRAVAFLQSVQNEQLRKPFNATMLRRKVQQLLASSKRS